VTVTTFSTSGRFHSYVRMDAISQESISRYFDLLESTLNEHQLENYPGQIYNMDGTGGSQTTKHNSKIWTKKVNYRQSGKKEQITVIGCGNAIGQSIPPMVTRSAFTGAQALNIALFNLPVNIVLIAIHLFLDTMQYF